jgi:hypothetical protein
LLNSFLNRFSGYLVLVLTVCITPGEKKFFLDILYPSVQSAPHHVDAALAPERKTVELYFSIYLF